jgi:CheY-like chemotaxis protein
MSLRILVVDDYEHWKQYVTAKLQNDLRYRVVGQAADGQSALEAAERLAPDLVLLDVGLPQLNGIEVARRLLASSPQTRILFLSVDQSPEIAQAALHTGAYGYVVKLDAANELLPAIAAVADGKTFVGSRFAEHPIGPSTIKRSSERLRHHDVCFSADGDSLVDCFTPFVEESLKAGGAAILAATPSHGRAIYDAMHAHLPDLDAAVAEGRYISLDIDEMLDCFMVDGLPDEARFRSAATALITAAASASKGPYPRVAACGEGVSVLCERGNAAAALRLEQLWDDVAATLGVEVLCGYSQRALGSDEQRIVADVCAVHSTACWR